MSGEIELSEGGQPLIPRPYQQAAFDAVITDVSRGVMRPLVVAPTASGKALIIAMLCKHYIDKGCKVLNAIHTWELVVQNAEHMSEMGLAPVIYSGRQKGDHKAQLVVGTIQTISNNPSLIESSDVIIVDEAHRMSSGSKQYGMLIKLASYDTVVIGLTATPFRTTSGCLVDGTDKIFDRKTYEIDVKGLIEDGYLSNILNKFTEREATFDLSRLKKNSVGEYSDASINEQAGTDFVATQAGVIKTVIEGTKRKKTIVFAASIAHADLLSDAFERIGMDNMCIHGDSLKGRVRDDVIAEAKSAACSVIINRDILTTGFNCPPIDLCVLARPTMSPVLYVQMIGRAMRIHPGKSEAIILDMAGMIEQHGPIDCPRLPDPEDMDKYGAYDRSPDERDEEEREAARLKALADLERKLAQAKLYDDESDLLDDVESLPPPKRGVGRIIVIGASLKPRVTRSGDVSMVLAVNGCDQRSGDHLQGEIYLNIFSQNAWARKKSQQEFSRLLMNGSKVLPPWIADYDPDDEEPCSMDGRPIMDDHAFRRKINMRARDVLRGKALMLGETEGGYATISVAPEIMPPSKDMS